MSRNSRASRTLISVFGLLISAVSLSAQTITEDVEVQGNYLRAVFDAATGGTASYFGLNGTSTNCAGPEGLFQEGFGVGSYYVPNRRLNARASLGQSGTGPKIVYEYDCDGPNIAGLHITRTVEPLINELSVRVQWTIENRGAQRQYITPWVQHDMTPGGSVDAGDRVVIPALTGLERAGENAYHAAARNWFAATDPRTRETIYGVFHADHTYAMRAEHNPATPTADVQVNFVPRIIEPGKVWSTAYRLNYVRGLERVDFATDELAAQIDYQRGTLTVLISASKALPEVVITGRVLAPNGRVWRLPDKRFQAEPDKLARCTYTWDAPEEGNYDFLAQLATDDGQLVPLGGDTGSPHGGIDAQFAVGTPGSSPMSAWTDAPYALEKGARTLDLAAAATAPFAAYWASSLEKIFPRDTPRARGQANAVGRVVLARGERESLQLVLRENGAAQLLGVRAEVGDLVAAGGNARISAADVAVYDVGYVDVRIPSNFESPTGRWPDPLPRHTAHTVPDGENGVLWFTVFARPDLPAGIYRGPLRIETNEGERLDLTLEAEVLDFQLPSTPSLQTDFGFWEDAALRGARAQRGNASAAALRAAYREDALAHRVTLREIHAFPAPAGNYDTALRSFEQQVQRDRAAGATSFFVSPKLLDRPEALARANAFVKAMDLGNRAFTQFAVEPAVPMYPRLLETIQRWQQLAPEIPVLTPTAGLQPFLPPTLPLWTVHVPVMDTTNAGAVLEHIQSGKPAWWYVNQAPPRPYANFYVDFEAVEHRILFWQTWGMGMRGLHYWGVNYTPEGQDPWKNVLDATPVNGDGLLVYPGADGPVTSIRWETIRDGIEDFDYLNLFRERINALATRGTHAALVERGRKALDLQTIVPSLVGFTRDGATLLRKREELGRLLVEIEAGLKR